MTPVNRPIRTRTVRPNPHPLMGVVPRLPFRIRQAERREMDFDRTQDNLLEMQWQMKDLWRRDQKELVLYVGQCYAPFSASYRIHNWPTAFELGRLGIEVKDQENEFDLIRLVFHTEADQTNARMFLKNVVPAPWEGWV